MATKTANVLARVEPEVKDQAEAVMNKLGIPASVVINMLYKQIIMTQSIPFPLSIPRVPVSREEMDADTFNQMMEQGLKEAKAGLGRPASEFFAELHQEL